jgi:putative transposase
MLPVFKLFENQIARSPVKLRRGECPTESKRVPCVKRTADPASFQLLPRRSVVERTLAWLNRNRCLAQDFVAPKNAKAWQTV